MNELQKAYNIIYKYQDFYICTNDLQHFELILKLETDGGIKILQANFPTPSPVLPFLHGAYVVYVNKKELRKQKLSFEDIYELTY